MGADAKLSGIAERIIPVVYDEAFEGTYELKIGETLFLDAVVTGRAGKLQTKPEMTVLNSQVAELNGNEVTGIKLGTTTVKFTYENLETSIKVKVVK